MRVRSCSQTATNQCQSIQSTVRVRKKQKIKGLPSTETFSHSVSQPLSQSVSQSVSQSLTHSHAHAKITKTELQTVTFQSSRSHVPRGRQHQDRNGRECRQSTTQVTSYSNDVKMGCDRFKQYCLLHVEGDLLFAREGELTLVKK